MGTNAVVSIVRDGQTFFNPRWDYGTAAYVFLVDADTWQITDVHGREDADD